MAFSYLRVVVLGPVAGVAGAERIEREDGVDLLLLQHRKHTHGDFRHSAFACACPEPVLATVIGGENRGVDFPTEPPCIKQSLQNEFSLWLSRACLGKTIISLL
jgi:hypothetical protein